LGHFSSFVSLQKGWRRGRKHFMRFIKAKPREECLSISRLQDLVYIFVLLVVTIANLFVLENSELDDDVITYRMVESVVFQMRTGLPSISFDLLLCLKNLVVGIVWI